MAEKKTKKKKIKVVRPGPMTTKAGIGPYEYCGGGKLKKACGGKLKK